MTDRFSPFDIVRGHLKGLKDRKYTGPRPVGVPDRGARATLYILPAGLAVCAWSLGWTVASPGSLLGGAGILVGAFFMGFSQVAVWRERFTERRDKHEVSEVHQRDSLDEALAHMLMAIYATGLLVVLIVVGENFADAKTGALVGGFAAGVVALGSYVMLLLGLILPKLYTAYTQINAVDDELSGLSK